MKPRVIRASTYLTVEATWRGKFLTGARIVKSTATKPRTAAAGAAVVYLTVEIPERVFRPYEIDALVTAQEGDVGTVRVVIEPFQADAEENQP